ncbi:MAG: hypothetical protein RR614_13595, partial [Eubacterium sp.]
VNSGEAVAKPEAVPTRDGYDFRYWSMELNGAEYDFAAPVNDTLRLYAVWEAKDVNYNIVYWTEKANVEGTPSWPDDYVSYEAGAGTAKAGTVIDDITKVVSSSEMPSVTFFKYGSTVPTTIQGNGLSVVNVCYDRIVYTMQFVLKNSMDSKVGVGDKIDWSWTSASPEGWSGTKTFTNPKNDEVVYQFGAKYEQDLSSLWPSLGFNVEMTNYEKGEVSASQPYGWKTLTARYSGSQGDVMFTKRLTLSPDMIPLFSSNAVFYAVGDPNLVTVHVNYWYEALEGQSGEKPVEQAQSMLGTTIYGKKYVKDDKLSQSLLNPKGGGVYQKEISGMIKAGFTNGIIQDDGSVRYDFYYNRNTLTLNFDSQGGSPVNSVRSVKDGQDVKR